MAAFTQKLRTHTTLDGRVLDLTNLAPEERDFCDRAVGLYLQEGATWDEISNCVTGSENRLCALPAGA